MLDSGRSIYIIPCSSVFYKYTPQKMAIHSATGEVFYAKGYGEVAIDLAELDLDQLPFHRAQSLFDTAAVYILGPNIHFNLTVWS
jgi:hypothetical protein